MELSKTASKQKIKYTIEFKIPHLQKLMGQWLNDQENNSPTNAKIHKFKKPIKKDIHRSFICQTEVSLPRSTGLGLKNMSSGCIWPFNQTSDKLFYMSWKSFSSSFFKAQY